MYCDRRRAEAAAEGDEKVGLEGEASGDELNGLKLGGLETCIASRRKDESQHNVAKVTCHDVLLCCYTYPTAERKDLWK